MTVVDEIRKTTTYGTPDGPLRFVESLGMEVPTFIDPRLDLIPNGVKNGVASGTFIRLDYHVPFSQRGDFKLEDWPESFKRKNAGGVRISAEGFVLCSGFSQRAKALCSNKAVNRTLFCRNHGAALHPADKVMSGFSQVDIPQDRVDRLDRIQQFMKDIITVEDLDDDEIRGGFIRDSNGVAVKGRKLGIVFEQKITKELHRRMNELIRSKTPAAIQTLADLMESDLVEPADRIKASSIILDRGLGKAPDVLITSTTEKPYEAILGGISGGSREEHRKNVASTRGSSRALDQLIGIQDAEEVDLSEMDGGEENSYVEQPSSFDEDFGNSTQRGNDDNFSGDMDTRDETSTSAAVDKITDRRATFKAKKEALKKQKARRFAARSLGATSLENLGFGMEWSLIKTGKYVGKLRLRLVSPDALTEARLAKIATTNELTDAALALLYPPDQGEDNG